jgi:hypothetical protein
MVNKKMIRGANVGVPNFPVSVGPFISFFTFARTLVKIASTPKHSVGEKTRRDEKILI